MFDQWRQTENLQICFTKEIRGEEKQEAFDERVSTNFNRRKLSLKLDGEKQKAFTKKKSYLETINKQILIEENLFKKLYESFKRNCGTSTWSTKSPKTSFDEEFFFCKTNFKDEKTSTPQNQIFKTTI